jgi:hypothetical protein
MISRPKVRFVPPYAIAFFASTGLYILDDPRRRSRLDAKSRSSMS